MSFTINPSILVEQVRFRRKLSPAERTAFIREWLESGAYRLAPGRPPKGEDALTPLIMKELDCSLSTARRAIAAALDRPRAPSKRRRSPKTVRIKVDREDVNVVVTTPTRAVRIALKKRKR